MLTGKITLIMKKRVSRKYRSTLSTTLRNGGGWSLEGIEKMASANSESKTKALRLLQSTMLNKFDITWSLRKTEKKEERKK